jgi:hypothetical protein
MPATSTESSDAFDVFLSHNSTDKPAIRKIKQRLENRGISCWLDEEELQPGKNWMEGLEAGIRKSRSTAIFIGAEGMRPWVKQEMLVALQLAVQNGKAVIPVFLPGVEEQRELTVFLSGRHCVYLVQEISEENLDQLIYGITGEHPKKSANVPPAPKEPAELPSATDCGQVMDAMEKAALINREKHYQAITREFRENGRCVFIIAGHQREWPEALAHKLSYDRQNGLYRKPIRIPYYPPPGTQPVDWLYEEIALNLLSLNPKGTSTAATLKSKVQTELRQRNHSCVIFIKVSGEKKWLPADIQACVDAWEREITESAIRPHFLLFLVEELSSNQRQKKKSPAWFTRWLFSGSWQSRGFIKDYLAELNRNGLQNRCLEIQDSPSREHVNDWVDDIFHRNLGTEDREALRTKVLALFDNKDILPHHDLGNQLCKLLQTQHPSS